MMVVGWGGARVDALFEFPSSNFAYLGVQYNYITAP